MKLPLEQWFHKREGKDIIKIMLGKPTVGANITSLPTKSIWCHYFNIFDMLSGIGQVPPTHPPLHRKSKRTSWQNV
jgi:hypothetical protein